MNKGALNNELTDVMADVVKAVRETGKQGTITLQLKVSMLNRRDEDVVKITPNVKSSVPELDRAETIMWSTADGDLLRNDPVQQDINLISISDNHQENVKLDNQERQLQKVN